MDKKVKQEPDCYGDLVIWFQIIDFAKEMKRPIILVTSERKEDWWHKVNGQIAYPRSELIGEMREKADVPFYMYRRVEFLEEARKKFTDIVITDQTIVELEQFDQADYRTLSIDLSPLIEQFQIASRLIDGYLDNVRDQMLSIDFSYLVEQFQIASRLIDGYLSNLNQVIYPSFDHLVESTAIVPTLDAIDIIQLNHMTDLASSIDFDLVSEYMRTIAEIDPTDLSNLTISAQKQFKAEKAKINNEKDDLSDEIELDFNSDNGETQDSENDTELE
jgi:hypothetical protein